MNTTFNDTYKDKDVSYYAHLRPELIAFIPKTVNKILDVGCGGGHFAQTIKVLYNCEAWGVEPNTVAANQAVARLDKVINNIFIDGLPELADQKFDLIFFNDVLEHLVDPSEALNYCKSLLTDGGQIIASIPNMRWYPVILSLLRYKDFKYELAGVMDKTHLRFFTMKSMRRLFEESGYKLITIKGINEDNGFTMFNIINFMLLNSQWDMKYKQFVIVATKN